MKKCMTVILVLVLAVLTLSGASANSWGLKGKLYQAVEQSKAWDNYTSVSNQADCFAVMGSRYHNALFYVDGEDQLHVYSTAVYQPEDKRKDVKLAFKNGTLTISYGKKESYTFRNTGNTFELTEAAIGNFRVTTLSGDEGYDWHYSAADKKDTAVYPVTVTLDTFNIRLFPHSAAEVRNINLMRGLLDDIQHCLGYGTEDWKDYSPDHPGDLLKPGKKGTAAVFSAPYGKKAWRAAKGKAAVGTNGNLWVLNPCYTAGGKAYACIRYDASERTQRIGWTLCSDLGLPENPGEGNADPFVHAQVEAGTATFLTDDPNVSQYAHFTVPKGTKLTCLGLYNNDYAYVASEKLAGKGSIIWGFVPVRDLKPVNGAAQKAVMKSIAGTWYIDSGGSMAGDILTLKADGSFVSGLAGGPDEDPVNLKGTWTVTKYDAAESLCWDNPKYRITLLYRNGAAQVYGLTYKKADEYPASLVLSDLDGAGGYILSQPDA